MKCSRQVSENSTRCGKPTRGKHPWCPDCRRAQLQSRPAECSRINPLTGLACGKATTGTHYWCPECRSRHETELVEIRESRAEIRGFVLGVEAMRKSLIDEVDRVYRSAVIPDRVMLTLAELGAMMKLAPAPRHTPKQAPVNYDGAAFAQLVNGG